MKKQIIPLGIILGLGKDFKKRNNLTEAETYFAKGETESYMMVDQVNMHMEML